MFSTERVFAGGSWTAFQVFLCNPTVDYEHPVPGFIGKEPGVEAAAAVTRQRVGSVRSAVSALQLRCGSYTKVGL